MDPLRGASWRLLDPPKFKVYLGNPHVGRVLGLCISNYFSDLEPSKYLLSLVKCNKTNTTVQSLHSKYSRKADSQKKVVVLVPYIKKI